MEQHNYNLYRSLSESIGHTPLTQTENVDGITWNIEADNLLHFYDLPTLEHVADHLNN